MTTDRGDLDRALDPGRIEGGWYGRLHGWTTALGVTRRVLRWSAWRREHSLGCNSHSPPPE